MLVSVIGVVTSGHADIPVRADEPKMGTMTIYKWDLMDDGLPAGTFNGILMYDTAAKGSYYTLGIPGMGFYNNVWETYSAKNYHYISAEAKTFYTPNNLMCQWFDFSGFDEDNDYNKKFHIYCHDNYELSHGGFLYCAWDDALTVRSERGDPLTFVPRGNGTYTIKWNTAGADEYLTHSEYLGGRGKWIDEHIYAYATTSSFSGAFKIYSMSPHVLSCLNNDYTIEKDQVFTVDNDVIITEDATLTIPEGAVLCIKKGNLYVNGKINCQGGTILVEEGGCIYPFASDKYGSYITMDNNSLMIIRSGGRVFAGCPEDELFSEEDGWFEGYSGTIINYGLLVVGLGIFENFMIENHSGGRAFLGYSVDDVGRFTSASFDGSTSPETLGLHKEGRCYIREGFCLSLYKGSGLTTNTGGGPLAKNVKIYSYDSWGKCTEYYQKLN